MVIWLVVWKNLFYDFPYIENRITPTDELIFFRGVVLPPTRWYSWGYKSTYNVWGPHSVDKIGIIIHEIEHGISERNILVYPVFKHNPIRVKNWMVNILTF